jgi:hypothetical protein
MYFRHLGFSLQQASMPPLKVIVMRYEKDECRYNQCDYHLPPPSPVPPCCEAMDLNYTSVKGKPLATDGTLLDFADVRKAFN